MEQNMGGDAPDPLSCSAADFDFDEETLKATCDRIIANAKNVDTGRSKKHRVQDAAALERAQQQVLPEEQGWEADGEGLDAVLDDVLRDIAFSMPGNGEQMADEEDDGGVCDWMEREMEALEQYYSGDEESASDSECESEEEELE